MLAALKYELCALRKNYFRKVGIKFSLADTRWREKNRPALRTLMQIYLPIPLTRSSVNPPPMSILKSRRANLRGNRRRKANHYNRGLRVVRRRVYPKKTRV